MMKWYITALIFISPLALGGELVSEHELTIWGYKVHNKSIYSPGFCISGSKPISASYLNIKSKAPIDSYKDTYFRFTLAKEEYASEEEAKKSFSRILKPQKRTSKHSKLCDLK